MCLVCEDELELSELIHTRSEVTKDNVDDDDGMCRIRVTPFLPADPPFVTPNQDLVHCYTQYGSQQRPSHSFLPLSHLNWFPAPVIHSPPAVTRVVPAHYHTIISGSCPPSHLYCSQRLSHRVPSHFSPPWVPSFYPVFI